MISICSRPREASRPPNPIDQHVGARVRVRRLMVGMSQTQLAEALEGRTSVTLRTWALLIDADEMEAYLRWQGHLAPPTSVLV
jgi:hypothetical protein